jgi:L-ascorbate metabolism protein UlaG (beta-lactamase superfamily)
MLLSTLFFVWFAADAPAVKPYLSSPRRTLTAPELKSAPEDWITRSLAWAEDTLAAYPPAVPEHPVRRAALIRLDDILHIEAAPSMPLVHGFFKKQVRRAAEEIAAARVDSGARLWKIYSHSWIVKTPSVTIAFDLVPGPIRNEGFAIEPDVLDQLVRQSDILFISHLHYDHANKDVAQKFLAAGKPVVAAEGLWANDPAFAGRLIYPKRSASDLHEVTVRQGAVKLRYRAYPGHQGKPVINNVHLVTTPENFTVVQTGDQSNDEDDRADWDWIMQIGNQHKVDVLLPNCWTNDIRDFVRGVNPRLVLTGHENEMGHTVDHREDYTQTYNHLFGTSYPFAVMSWGESFFVKP